jgi:hypothetical protein
MFIITVLLCSTYFEERSGMSQPTKALASTAVDLSDGGKLFNVSAVFVVVVAIIIVGPSWRRCY